MRMDNHVVVDRDHPLDLKMGLGELVAQKIQKALETLDILGPSPDAAGLWSMNCGQK
jgi:hypothetical protein